MRNRERNRCILVPLTLAPRDEENLPAAQEQAHAFEADVILLHVLRQGALDPEAVSSSEAVARAYLDTIVIQMRAAGVRAHPRISAGPAAATILEEAQVQQADLIILGTTAQTVLPGALRGSIGSTIIRRASCPVLLLRPARKAHRGHRLCSFADAAARAGPLTPCLLGLRTVELARVTGSVGRAQELGAGLRQFQGRPADKERYRGMLAAVQRGAVLPPVELYKLGYGYYILNGHHRVAAARQVGQVDIDAIVTEFVPLGDVDAERAFTARQAFERATGLTRIEAARPEHYADLRALIETHGRLHGNSDVQEAARRWYGEVFRPLRRRMRALELARYFPGERSADLIARLGRWRVGAADREGTLLTWEETLTRFVATVTQGAARA